MSIFTDSILETYKNDPRVEPALKGITLLNLNTFNQYFAPLHKTSDRLLEEAKKIGPEAEKKNNIIKNGKFN